MGLPGMAKKHRKRRAINRQKKITEETQNQALSYPSGGGQYDRDNPYRPFCGIAQTPSVVASEQPIQSRF
jgi:hypothetical protein